IKARLAPKHPIQANKITSSCEICSGRHDTQYYLENPEQAFIDYASSRTGKARGRPRYMYIHYLDAHIICRSLGNLQYFITFTCNVKWPEIKRYMESYPGLTPSDRADIVCRVFEQKVNDFIKFLKYEKPFGYMTAFLYTIEFQKRGLPHCHTLLWVGSGSKIKDARQIDNYISAEIPDHVKDPTWYKVVTELMIHGPCGVVNPSATCTENRTCSKNFTKKYNDITFFDTNGHTHYRRRQTEIHVMKGESRLDNCNVVSYNQRLSLAFHAHINVEYCGWSMLIKYFFKYISKGLDRILAKVSKPIGDTSTSVHKQHVEVDEIQNYVNGHFVYPFEACWRIFDFPIQCEVWTINGKVLPTYGVACKMLGLLGDDKEWDIALEESAVSASSAELRTLFT
nr:DNA helicase [Tanacetum cinerariifolium]